MKNILKWIGNIGFTIGLILVAFLLFSVIQSKIVNGPPTIGGHQMYIVIGGSMSPTFEAGSLAIIKSTPPESIKVGDVVTYKGVASEAATTHRVVDIVRSNGAISFVTRGDANDVDDPSLLDSSQLVGRVVFTVPYLGKILSFSQSRMGLVALIIIPGVLLIIFEILSMIKTVKKMKAEKLSKENPNVVPSTME